MKIELNASQPANVKLHMEAVWNALYNGKVEETYRFKNYGVKVSKTDDGYVSEEFEINKSGRKA